MLVKINALSVGLNQFFLDLAVCCGLLFGIISMFITGLHGLLTCVVGLLSLLSIISQNLQNNWHVGIESLNF